MQGLGSTILGLLGGAGGLVGVTPFRVLITLLITYLLSPLPLQVGLRVGRGSRI